MATGRLKRVLWAAFIGCIMVMVLGACSAIIGQESLPKGVQSLKVDFTFTEFLILYVVACEIFPFLKGKPGNVVYNILKIINRFKK